MFQFAFIPTESLGGPSGPGREKKGGGVPRQSHESTDPNMKEGGEKTLCQHLPPPPPKSANLQPRPSILPGGQITWLCDYTVE